METIEQQPLAASGAAAPRQAAYDCKLADLRGPKGVPFFGNLKQINPQQFHLAFERWAAEFGGLFRVNLGRRQVLVVPDPVVTRAVLRDRPGALRRGSRLTSGFDKLGSNGQLVISSAFSAEGENWHKQRRLVMRALTPQVIRNFHPTMVGMTERLLRRWQLALEQNHPIDLLRDIKAYTLDVTVGLALGQDLNTLENPDDPLHHDITQIFNRVARRMRSVFQYWRYFKLPIDRADDASAMRIEKAVTGFIATTRENIRNNPQLREKPTNLLEALVVARDEPGSEFNDFNVIGNAVLMIFAGEDTTAHTTAWLLNFIARHPKVARRLTEEADAAIGDDTLVRNFSSLDQFDYTMAATTETLRIKPAAPLLNLETNEEMVIGGVLVPKGTAVITELRHAGRQEADFPNAQEFQPERWLEDSQADAYDDPERKLFPFGGGPRFCPGRYLAMVEIRMMISMIMRNFTVEVVPDAPPVEEFFSFTLTPSALPLRLKPRQQPA